MTKEVALFSGGKDSLCTMIESGCKYALYCKTGVGLNQDYAQRMCDKQGVHMYVYEPLPRFTFETFVSRFGFPKQGAHNMIFSFIKWRSIRRFAKEHKDEDILFLSGRRKRESKRRQRNAKIIRYDKPEKYIKIDSPLFTWTNAEIWDYVHAQNLELSPCYWDLDISGDCLCGAFSTDRESRILWKNYRPMAEYLRGLEIKYGGHWGNGVSLTGASKETTLEAYTCQECQIASQ